jgi:hypothetical protein
MPVKFAVPSLVVLGGLLLCSTATYSKPAYTTKEKKPCTFCHVDAKAKPKEMTEAGKYYAEHKHSLDGYKAAQ